MKTVIFLGGTPFSGSTFFHMTLANDPKGFACGDVNTFMHPTRPGHFSMVCGCRDETCTIWQKAKAAGDDGVYESIFEQLPGIDFLVDSSRNPLWTHSQMENLAARGIQTKNILMWKTPLEFAHSARKRKHHILDWEKTWVNYHRLYYTLVDDWRAVQYRAYTQDPSVLSQVCEYLDIPYFPGKEAYWKKDHHLVGGNPTARVHLYSKKSHKYSRERANTSAVVEDKEHQSIYYENIGDEELRQQVEQRTQESKYIREILTLLKERDVSEERYTNGDRSQLRVSEPAIVLRRVRDSLLHRYKQYRYGHLANS